MTKAAEQKRAYDDAIEAGNMLIQTVIDAESATAAAPLLKNIKHALTSEKEVAIAWNNHIKALGLIYDKVLKAYTPAPEEKKEGQ